jgi:hypothetical protein
MYFRGKMRGKIEFYVGNLGDIMYKIIKDQREGSGGHTKRNKNHENRPCGV